MKGTIIDFLDLVADKPELARDLCGLAAKYDFHFTDDELGEEELDQVAGGTTSEELQALNLQMTMDRRSKFISTLSQMMKKISTTDDSLVQNIK